jgi:hypothetical protein
VIRLRLQLQLKGGRPAARRRLAGPISVRALASTSGGGDDFVSSWRSVIREQRLRAPVGMVVRARDDAGLPQVCRSSRSGSASACRAVTDR